MLKALQERVDQRDEGFTLIELMVVVLIIGILMAIAIPTFLGAKGKANDKAAQEDIRNALTAEKTYFVDQQVYAGSTAVATLEPSLSFVGATPSGTAVEVSLSQPTGAATANSSVLLVAQSAAGNCFAVFDVGQAGTSINVGTYYASKNANCSTWNPTPPTSTPTNANSSLTGTWSLAW